MSETKSLLATVLVREGVLLVQNRDFLVLEQRDRDFRHIECVVLGEGGGGVRPNQTNYPWIRHWHIATYKQTNIHTCVHRYSDFLV